MNKLLSIASSPRERIPNGTCTGGLSSYDLLKRVLMIHHIWEHHSELGGSGFICHYIPAQMLSANRWPFGNAPHGSRRWDIGRKLFDAGIVAHARRYELIHFIHADNHPGVVFKLAKRVHPWIKLLGTIHLPLDYYSLESSLAAMGRLDGIISLAKHQVEEVRRHLPDVKVWHVPCGFDFEHPYRDVDAYQREKAFNVLIVGSNYRDWPTCTAILELAARKHPEWKFHFVGIPARQKEAYADRANVVIHPRLTDPEYFALFSRAHVLLLPLAWATNNTAVLEAYSVGLPTLCTDLPAIADYAVSTTQTFSTAEEALERLEAHCAMSPESRHRVRERTYGEGKQFEWRNIARQVMGIYRQLLGPDGT